MSFDYLLAACFKEFVAKEKLKIVKERGEPACGRAANYVGFSSPPQAAKCVRNYLKNTELVIKIPPQLRGGKYLD